MLSTPSRFNGALCFVSGSYDKSLESSCSSADDGNDDDDDNDDDDKCRSCASLQHTGSIARCET